MKSKIANLLSTAKINHFFTCFDRVFVVFDFKFGPLGVLYTDPFTAMMELNEQSLVDCQFCETIAEELDAVGNMKKMRPMIIKEVEKVARVYLADLYALAPTELTA